MRKFNSLKSGARTTTYVVEKLCLYLSTHVCSLVRTHTHTHTHTHTRTHTDGLKTKIRKLNIKDFKKTM